MKTSNSHQYKKKQKTFRIPKLKPFVEARILLLKLYVGFYIDIIAEINNRSNYMQVFLIEV